MPMNIVNCFLLSRKKASLISLPHSSNGRIRRLLGYGFPKNLISYLSTHLTVPSLLQRVVSKTLVRIKIIETPAQMQMFPGSTFNRDSDLGGLEWNAGIQDSTATGHMRFQFGKHCTTLLMMAMECGYNLVSCTGGKSGSWRSG